MSDYIVSRSVKVLAVFCKLSNVQEIVYKRLLECPEVLAILKKDEVCPCKSGKKRYKCCFQGVPNGFLWKKYHPDGVPCVNCPSCLGLPLVTKLMHIADHLERIKPVELAGEGQERSNDEKFARYLLKDVAHLLNGMTRCYKQMKLGNTLHCGKLKVIHDFI